MRKLATVALAALLAASAGAAPQDPTVVSGQAQIVPGTGGLTIQQLTDKAIVDWRSFSIGSGEWVRFLQPSQWSAILNRVTGQDPSLILGALNANGQVFLVNPNGIVFGPTARVDVGSLFATTMQISNQDFMSGNYAFRPDPTRPDSFVINQGRIQAAEGGYVVLLAPLVENQGSIVAQLGTVTLAAAPRTTVNFDGQGLVSFVLPGDPAGDVVMPADLVSHAVSGVVPVNTTDAGGVQVANGQVLLVGGSGLALHEGQIEAAGGRVVVLGQRVGLLGEASVDVSAPSGGGSVVVGGDLRIPGLPVAEAVYAAPGTNILADATVDGPGGWISLLSTGTTRSHGLISVQGGPEGGDGGFVDTSGPFLEVTRAPRLGAPKGDAGTWLLDPNNILISNSAPIPGGTTVANPFESTGDNAELHTSLLQTALFQGGTVIVRTMTAGTNLQDGNIVVASPIQLFSPSVTPATLVLEAHNDVEVQDTIGGAEPFSVVLRADRDQNGAGNVILRNIDTQTGDVLTGGGSLETSGVDLVMEAGTRIDTSGGSGGGPPPRTSGGDVTMLHSGSVLLNGSVEAGAVSIGASGSVTGSGLVTASALSVTSGGSVDLTTDVDTLDVSSAGDVLVDQSIGVNLAVDASSLVLSAGGSVTGEVSVGSATIDADGSIQLITAVDNLTARSAGGVDIVQTGSLRVEEILANDLTLSVAGDLTVAGQVSTAQGFDIQATGSILSASPPTAGLLPATSPPLLEAGADSSLTAGAVIGTTAAPLEVSVIGGTLTTAPSGSQNGVSANLNGSVTPSNTLIIPNTPPGQVIFNGQVLFPPPAPPPTPPAPVPEPVPTQAGDPVSSAQLASSPNLVPTSLITQATGAGQQQLNTLSGLTREDLALLEFVFSDQAGPLIPTVTADLLGLTSGMSHLAPPSMGTPETFVLAALLQVSVDDPSVQIAALQDLSGSMTRSQFVALLVTGLGRLPDSHPLRGTPAFLDTASDPASGAIALARELGWLDWAGEAFQPGAQITLSEALRTLLAALRVPAGPDAIAQAVELGLFPSAVPDGVATRGALYRLLDSAFLSIPVAGTGKTVYQARFEKSPPSLTVAAVPQVWEGTSLPLSGTVSPDTTLLRVGYSDQDVVRPDDTGAWTASVPLKPGLNTITVQAYDGVGNLSEQTIQVLCTVQP
ncbi:MAG: filamentous hemagglutinin N-terminal domain-containing protein [Candidatus Eremiobacterota bacterium]